MEQGERFKVAESDPPWLSSSVDLTAEVDSYLSHLG